MAKKEELEPKQPDNIYIPSEKEKDVLDFIQKRIKAMDQHRQKLGLEANWDKWTKQCDDTETIRDTDLHIKNPSNVKKSLTGEAVYGILAMTMARNNEVQLIMQSEDDGELALVFQKVSDHL